MDYSDALESLLADQEMEVYLSDNADVVLTVAGNSDSQNSQILETVESCASGYENIHCHSGDTEEIHHAHDAGLSFGKYQAYLTLKELLPSVTLEEVQDMTMSQIRELIQEYSQEDSQGSSQGNSQGNSRKNSSDSTDDSSDAAQESTAAAIPPRLSSTDTMDMGIKMDMEKTTKNSTDRKYPKMSPNPPLAKRGDL